MMTMRPYTRFVLYGLPLSALSILVGFIPSCTTQEGDNNYYTFGGASGLGGAPTKGDGDGDGPGDGDGDGDGDEEGYSSYPPACINKVDFADLEIDLFGQDGHRFYFEVTPEARLAGDEQRCNFGNDGHGVVYSLGDDGGSCPIAAINVRVLPAGSKSCADTGKVEVDLPGQSSFKPWAEIPNIKLDVGEFQELAFPSGDRQVRLNNGQADSTIVREAVALRIWDAMGYPVPKTRFVQTQSNVWDTEVRPGVTAAHVMVQPYKQAFFEQRLPKVVSVWEGSGDFFQGDDGCGEFGCGGCDDFGCFPIDDWGGEVAQRDVLPGPLPGGSVNRGGFYGDCQWSVEEECNEEGLTAIIEAVAEVPRGSGFMDATSDIIDWPMLHQNQCLSALTGTGDDWIHNSNNVVLAMLDSGKVFYLPYSTDISGGHPWYPETPFDGYVYLTSSCQEDPDCREESLSTCEEMINSFENLDVATTIVDERCSALEKASLDRAPDAGVCKSMKEFYNARPAALRKEIAFLRDGGGLGGFGGDMSGDGDIGGDGDFPGGKL